MNDTAGYTIAYEEDTQILRLRLWGLWSVATLAQFGGALLLKVMGLKVRGAPFDMLSDSRDFAVQTGVVAVGFERMMDRGAKTHVGYMAIVVGSQLNKLQAQRTLRHPRLRVFLDLDEARAWLMSHRPPTA